jgi:DNA-binding transcriptional regulator YdaS (Cro superfamily)
MNTLPPSFLLKVDKSNPQGCWPWTGEVRKPSGLPSFNKKLANRLAWETHYGAIPEKSAVKTTCGMKHCMNPDHMTIAAMGKPQAGIEARFWAFVDKQEGDGCWLWTGEPHTSGYGRIGLHDQGHGMEYAHRYSFELHFGKLPASSYVAHRCDVKLCVRPEHLFLSDKNVQNMADAAKKDRIAHGERHGNGKFSDARIAELRRMSASGMKNNAIAQILGISPAYVSQLKSRVRRVRDTTVPLIESADAAATRLE